MVEIVTPVFLDEPLSLDFNSLTPSNPRPLIDRDKSIRTRIFSFLVLLLSGSTLDQYSTILNCLSASTRNEVNPPDRLRARAENLGSLTTSNRTLELEVVGVSLLSNGEKLDWDDCWWKFGNGDFYGLDFEVMFFRE